MPWYIEYIIVIIIGIMNFMLSSFFFASLSCGCVCHARLFLNVHRVDHNLAAVVATASSLSKCDTEMA